MNGATGRIVDIIFAPNIAPPSLPEFVLVSLDNERYEGPMIPHDEYHRLIAITPIVKRTTDETGRSATRQQIPLILAHGLTVHKAQGATLFDVTYHPGR